MAPRGGFFYSSPHGADHFIAHLHRHAAAQQQVAGDVHQVRRRGVLLCAFHHGQRGVLGRCRGVGLEAAGFQCVGARVVGALHGTHGACTVHHGGGDVVAVGGAGGHGLGGDLRGQVQGHVLFGAHAFGAGGGGDQGQGEGGGFDEGALHGVLRCFGSVPPVVAPWENCRNGRCFQPFGRLRVRLRRTTHCRGARCSVGLQPGRSD